jgi:hypothetical protein
MDGKGPIMMDSLVRNLRVLWRAESIIAEIQVRQALTRSGLRGLAVLLAGFAFLMLNLAGFFVLERIWDPAWASAALAAVNLGLAGLLLALAGRTQPGRDLALAVEVRDTALQALEMDARVLQKQMVDMTEDVRSLKKAVVGFVRNPMDAVLPSMLIPLAGAVVKSIAKSGKKE